MPLSGGKRIVDVDQIQEYLDEIRANLPGELRQAQAIVNDRSQIVDSANAQAKAIIRQAEERARVLVSESEIVKSAQQRASEIMAQAQAESRTLRQTTADYCDNMLKTTEETMVANEPLPTAAGVLFFGQAAENWRKKSGKNYCIHRADLLQ